MTEDTAYQQGYCQAKTSHCRFGNRRVRVYNGILWCDRCWPFRKRAVLGRQVERRK